MINAPATRNGQTGIAPSSPESVDLAAGGPGVPVAATVSRNDHAPDTGWPSADVTR
jgi:hypothetical protein